MAFVLLSGSEGLILDMIDMLAFPFRLPEEFVLCVLLLIWSYPMEQDGMSHMLKPRLTWIGAQLDGVLCG